MEGVKETVQNEEGFLSMLIGSLGKFTKKHFSSSRNK